MRWAYNLFNTNEGTGLCRAASFNSTGIDFQVLRFVIRVLFIAGNVFFCRELFSV